MKWTDKYKVYPYASIHNNVALQQLGLVKNWELHNVSRSSKNFIQRLKKWTTLEGHSGCVNTVSWNTSGTLLLSGSDDYLINIYDIYAEKMLHSIESGHRANIFSAKFIPCTSDMKIVSCSGDGMLHYNELGTNYGENFFNCHSGTTYEVLVTPGDPNTFLSCGEDGTVRLFDLRTKTKCHCQECSEDILIDTRHAVTSVSINPLSPYHLAAGCKDSYVRVFDRRTLGTSVNTRSVNRNRGWMPGLFCKFKPEKLRKDASCRITSLRYSDDGSSILVSYCTDYVYTFSVNDKQGKFLDTKGTKSDNGYHTNGTKNSNVLDNESEGLPPVKRLRLRGDWSDTGPQARPETAEENVPENNLMQRMSELFSRWLEDAISSPLERQASQGSNNSEVEGSQTENEEPNAEQDTTCPNIEHTENEHIDNNDNNSNNDENNDEHTGASNEPISNECPLEASMDSVDTNWMLCSTDTESENTDNKCGNKNNSNVNVEDSSNNNDNITQGSSGNCSIKNDPTFIEEDRRDVESKPFCEQSTNEIKVVDVDTTASIQLCSSDISESLSSERPCNRSSTSMNSINEGDANYTSPATDNFLDEKTLWPDDFNTGYPSDDDSAEETDTKVDLPMAAESSSRCIEMTPFLSTKQKNDKKDEQCYGALEINQMNKVCHQLTDVDKLYDVVNDDTCSSSRMTTDTFVESESGSHCSTADAQFSCDEYQSKDTDERTDMCSKCHETGQSSSDISKCTCGSRQVVDNEDLKEDKRIVNRQHIPVCMSTPNSKQDISGICNTTNSTIEADEMEASAVQPVENMEVSAHASDRNVDVGTLSSSHTPTRPNELLFRVMQQSSREAESESTDDFSGHTDQLSNDNAESLNNLYSIEPGEYTIDSTDESQGSADYSRMRERAATRIQKFLRLNKSKFNSSEENYDQDMNPIFIPTQYSVFKGHRNARTMIKEANFWGEDYILSGSDCGRIFIWDRHTGDLVMLLQGDSHVVNCVQPHPFDPILASSGIDHDVKIWAPLADELPDLTDMAEIVNRNEQMLEESRDTITVPASFVLRMLASFGSRRRRRTSYRRIGDDPEENES